MMASQINAIVWAQFRMIRNRLPQTSFGTVLTWLLAIVWYGLYLSIAVVLAAWLPSVPAQALPLYLSEGLLAMLIFWQIFPLMTLSTGWSLDLNQLLIYPIRQSTLLAVDLLLRITTAPEMLIVLVGMSVGLMWRNDVPIGAPFTLIIFVAFNLLLSLGVREWMTGTFKRKRFRELTVILFVTITVLPSLLINTSLGTRLKPVFFSIARLRGAPWHEASSLAIGRISTIAVAAWTLWLTLAFVFAKMQFSASMNPELEHVRGGSRQKNENQRSRFEFFFTLPSRLFRDPLAALLEKEARVLTRSPRFRVIFGMACVFSLVIFYPVAFGRAGSTFLASNYLPAVNSYGLLILGEVLLWNVFGFDRKATQIYFLAPVRFESVLRAKNLIAIATVLLMTVFISVVDEVVRRRTTLASITSSVGLTLVITLFFLGLGNLTSVMIPRPIDPNQAFRNQNSGKASLWLLICFVLITLPVALAFAARWAFGGDWAFLAVLAIDLLIGAIFYTVATASAVERAERERERILDALSKGPGLIST